MKKKITSKVYSDYPEQPFISENRNLEQWEQYPERFPYSKVEKKQMIRTKEGLLPGDIVLLWRIGFDNFTNETHIPDYFEYRYGVDSNQSLKDLIDKKYVYVESAQNTLDLISSPILKRILKENDLKVGGKKQELVDRLISNLSEQQLESSFETRRIKITKEGKKVLDSHQDIITKHGPKEY